MDFYLVLYFLLNLTVLTLSESLSKIHFKVFENLKLLKRLQICKIAFSIRVNSGYRFIPHITVTIFAAFFGLLLTVNYLLSRGLLLFACLYKEDWTSLCTSRSIYSNSV